MPLDQLLIFAVAHELGHALCQETDEARAKAYADQLRRTGRSRDSCAARSEMMSSTTRSSAAHGRVVHSGPTTRASDP